MNSAAINVLQWTQPKGNDTQVLAQPNDISPNSATTNEPSEKQRAAYSEIVINEDLDKLKTYISPGAVVKGSLELPQGARIAGIVTGDLTCHDGSAVIESTGHVHGSIHASQRVIVMGGKAGTEPENPKERPTTQVVCPGHVVIVGPGIVHAEAYYDSLSVYDGGTLDGGSHPFAKHGLDRR